MARDDRSAWKRAEAWRLQAACRPFDSDLFFPDRAAYRNSDVARAKAVCRTCPVRQSCLQAALDGREKIGIWGGMTPQERLSLRRRERRAQDPAAAAATPAATPVAASAEPGPDAGSGYPTREQIRRGVAAGWLRIDPVRFGAEGESAPA